MDYFKSVILNRDVLSDIDGHTLVENLSHDLVGNDDPQMNILVDGLDKDDLVIDTMAWGWWDGGLHKLLKLQHERPVAPREALFFRGAALFGNFDDAKNDYLMDPMVEIVDHSAGLNDGNEPTSEHHIPFGMVIPHWEVGRMIEFDILKSVTIILFWQSLDD